MKPKTSRRLKLALLAIVLGNGVYFFLYPRLPAVWRHQPFVIDRGLALDFLLCAALYGLLHLGVGLTQRARGR
jgi:hypothetical protein